MREFVDAREMRDILKSPLRTSLVMGEDKPRLASDMPELNGSRSPTADAYRGS